MSGLRVEVYRYIKLYVYSEDLWNPFRMLGVSVRLSKGVSSLAGRRASEF